MTPLASQMYRHGEGEIRARLAQCQFFECTAIFPLAREMHAAEHARLSEPGNHGVAPFSEFSQLPKRFHRFGMSAASNLVHMPAHPLQPRRQRNPSGRFTMSANITNQRSANGLTVIGGAIFR